MLDLSLYLVTSSENLPVGSTVEWAVEEAIHGGVTLVQLREKNLPTRSFLQRARSLRKICKAPVKLIINDRIDIALACKADGVHLGQEDMPIEAARKILGKGAIIGISVNTVTEALAAVDQGANYLGVGTCWPTGTKAIPEHKVIGPRGVKIIQDELIRLRKSIPIVVIGGINSNNLIRTLYGCLSTRFYTCREDESPVGVAVVSAIMSSSNPYEESLKLKNLIHEFSRWLKILPIPRYEHLPVTIQERFKNFMSKFMSSSTVPLIHHITNTVVQNDCANLALAYRCSPIMSSNVNEVEEFVQPGCLVLNLGTFNENQIQAMKLAGRKANLIGKPIIFDPVGVGASSERRKKANEILNYVQVSVIKGNQAEIATLARFRSNGVNSHGVDATGEVEAPEELVRRLAQQELCLVLMTGKTDWISDGNLVYMLCNGTEELSAITGSGCMAGTSIACFVACSIQNELDKGFKSSFLNHMLDITSNGGTLIHSAALGVSVINVLAELIKQTESNQSEFGPNTLKMKIMDSLYRGKKDENFWNHILSKLRISALYFEKIS